MARKKEPEPVQRKHAFCYARASTGRQTDSIEGQKERCEEYFKWKLKLDGFTWGGVYEDPATSGKTEFCSRHGGLALDLELQPGDAVIITKVDRAFRNARDTLNIFDRWKARGIGLHILSHNIDTSTPMGKALLSMSAVFAELEGAIISERCLESKAWRKLNGKPVGPPPYGFKCVGKHGDRSFAPCPFTRRIGRWVVKQKLRGRSYEAMYWTLIEAGERNKKGKEWSRTTLFMMFRAECLLMQDTPAGRALLERWRRAGLKRRGIEPTTSGHAPTITEETWPQGDAS